MGHHLGVRLGPRDHLVGRRAAAAALHRTAAVRIVAPGRRSVELADHHARRECQLDVFGFLRTHVSRARDDAPSFRKDRRSWVNTHMLRLAAISALLLAILLAVLLTSATAVVGCWWSA